MEATVRNDSIGEKIYQRGTRLKISGRVLATLHLIPQKNAGPIGARQVNRKAMDQCVQEHVGQITEVAF